ncbi:hypothetical protein ACFFLM_02220 [Deinococcus oregonensis]|uniref:Acyl-CoA dehydrogenase n=1 Tax=Deinococcus oregonensis TaxID=1805970 RepID=A0ABV6ATJ0_9DEIO
MTAPDRQYPAALEALEERLARLQRPVETGRETARSEEDSPFALEEILIEG